MQEFYIFYKHTNIYFNEIYCEPSAGPTCSGLCRGTAFVQVEAYMAGVPTSDGIVQAG